MTTRILLDTKRYSAISPASCRRTAENTRMKTGVAEFDNVRVCTVEVYVDGTLQVEVGVGLSDHEDVTVCI